MNKGQENNLSMWGAVHDMLVTYEESWRSLEAFVAAVDRFRAVRANFEPEAQKQQNVVKGVAASKEQLRITLISNTLQLAANLEAFAIRTGNREMKAKVSVTFSELNRLRDQGLPVVVKNLQVQAQNHIDELRPYGITPEVLAAHQRLLEQYEQASAAPRTAISTRKTSTASIAALIREGNGELEVMDLLVGNFKLTDPAFVSDYRNARIVVNNSGGGSRQDPPKDK